MENQKTIIFVSTKHHVELVHAVLTRAEIDSACLYSKMDPTARRINVAKFSKHGVDEEEKENNEKKVQEFNNENLTRKILVTTDVAARGIDVPLLDNVINFDFPATSKLFVIVLVELPEIIEKVLHTTLQQVKKFIHG